MVPSELPGVELRFFDLDRLQIDDAARWLSPSEVDRAAKFVFARDALRFRAAHVALRRALAAQCGLAPRVEFEIGANGKPCLSSPGCGFNLSHTGNRALIGIAIDEGRGDIGHIGVDIESVKHFDDLELLAQDTLTQSELAELAQACPASRVETFLRGWTRKEACLKAVGSGLTVDARSVHVGLGTDTRIVTFSIGSERLAVKVTSLDAGHGILAAVALSDAMNHN